MAILRIPITHYCHEVKERRGLGIVVMEETMETRVAKGTALNSEERNEKWGVTVDSRAGHFSKSQSFQTMAMVWVPCIVLQIRERLEFKNFREPELLSGQPFSPDLSGERQ